LATSPPCAWRCGQNSDDVFGEGFGDLEEVALVHDLPINSFMRRACSDCPGISVSSDTIDRRCRQSSPFRDAFGFVRGQGSRSGGASAGQRIDVILRRPSAIEERVA